MVDPVSDGAPSNRDRRAHVYDLVAAEPAGDIDGGMVGLLQRLCRALVGELRMTGAAISLMSPSGSEGVIAGSDENSMRVDELQFDLGEGPCHDAFTERRPVLTADLVADGSGRWPGYAPAAIESGMDAVFAFPLGSGAAGVGVLDVYADRPGSLDNDQVTWSLTFAQLATEILLDGHEAAPDGQIAAGLEFALSYRSEIHQAQGMVMVQLDVNLTEALARMRARAFGTERDLTDVARDIVARRERFDREDL